MAAESSEGALAKAWEADLSLRQRARETGKLTAWRNTKLIGLASCDAMKYNVAALEILARHWTAMTDLPKAVPIALIRSEVVTFLKLVVVEEVPANTSVDSWGLKRLFSHGLRRWLSGAAAPRDPALQGFWDILDFAWGDPQQYPDVAVIDSGSTDSLDAHVGRGGDGGDDPSDGAAPAVPASDPASGAPSNDVETVEPEPAREYLIPFVPDYMVTDSQPVSVNPTDSEAETTPLKPPAPSKTDPYAYEVPAASTGASGSMDAAVKDAQQQLLLAQIRLARALALQSRAGSGSVMDNLNTLPMTVEEPSSKAMCIHGDVVNLDTQEMADTSASGLPPAASSLDAPMETKEVETKKVEPPVETDKTLHPPMETQKVEPPVETDKTLHPPMETKKVEPPVETDKTLHPPMETKKVEPTVETDKTLHPPMETKKVEPPVGTDKTLHPPMEIKKVEPPVETDKTLHPPMETKKVEPSLMETDKTVQALSASKPEASQALQPEGADQDVKSLMGLKAPIILRRDQINADFRNKAEDEGGDEAEDDEDQGDGEDEPTKPKRKTPTGKAKSKPKGKAKAKAKAKGRGRATASSKSKAAQKDEKDEEHKEDKAKADDKGKDDTKDKPVSSRKRKSVEPDTDQNVEGGDKDEPNAPKRWSGCGTFAGRYRPSDEGSLNRFMAIEKTFMEKIAPLIKRQSAFQDKFYTECMLIIKGSEAIKYEEYLLIAQGKVASFLARDDVSNSLK